MNYKAIAMLLLSLSTIIPIIADILNVKALKPTVHPEFKDLFDDDRYKKSQEYLKAKTSFSIIQSLLSLVFMLFFLQVNGFSYIEIWLQSVSPSLGIQSALFLGIFILLSTLWSIPFSLYSNFVIEEKFGFNKMTGKTFTGDTLKGLFLTLLLGVPLYVGLIFLLKSLGHNAWLVAWGALFLVQLLFMFLAPAIIMPLFNKFTPLEDGELKERIDQYAHKVGFNFSGITVMDGSKRSSKANAFFTGFGKLRKIALFDTLIEKHTPQELEAILAHEVGHFKKHHIWQMILFSLFSTGILFFLMGQMQNNEAMYQSFGFSSVTFYALPFLFSFFMIPLNFLFGILQMTFSRKNEFEADAFARETSTAEALIAGLKRLSVDSLSNLEPHRFKVFLEYSHPPVLERIKALRERK